MKYEKLVLLICEGKEIFYLLEVKVLIKIKGGFTVNTTGFIRGYMAKNMKTERYLKVVIEAVEKEFQWEVTCEQESKDNDINYILTIEKAYIVKLNVDTLRKLQEKSPYSLDKYIYEKLMEQGVDIDKKRSQYIQYCFLR